MPYRDEARRALECSAARKAQNSYLTEAKARHEALAAFPDVDALLALLRNRDGDHDQKDAALLALVSEHQGGHDGRAFALLAVAMFPKLDRIYNTRRRGLAGPEHDELWGRIVEAFAEALDRYPTARRPKRVAANIEGETMAALRRARQREVRSAEAQARLSADVTPFLDLIAAPDPTADSEDTMTLGDLVEPGREAPVQPDATEMHVAERALDRYVAGGVIDAADRFLLIGVHLDGRTLGDLAGELGITREAAKKRHQRALDRLREMGRPGPERK
jgi:DNA-directed RNA polymerase specialized sigma24 family protein